MHEFNFHNIRYDKFGLLLKTTTNNMDYRQKMVVSISQKHKQNDDNDDDDDLEELRLAALKSLKPKTSGASNKQTTNLSQSTLSQTSHVTSVAGAPLYNNQQRSSRNDYFYQNILPRQNGNVYYPCRNNKNLIEIVPVEANAGSTQDAVKNKSPTSDPLLPKDTSDGSKFNRYEDDASGSDEEEVKNSKLDIEENVKVPEPVKEINKTDETGTDKENQSESEEETLQIDQESDNARDRIVDQEEEEEEEEEKYIEDDDDVLVMADHEEEDSLERLMDEMEREMNDEKILDKNEKKILPNKSSKDIKRVHETTSKNRTNKNRIDDKKENSSSRLFKNDYDKSSSYSFNDVIKRNRSLSPKHKQIRKKSPRRSPSRQIKKSQRDNIHSRSPRKLSPRYSPRPRSRTPIRRLSPRQKSPHSRSPLRYKKSRSPQISSRSRSPRYASRSRLSPAKISPRTRSPTRNSPIRLRSPKRSSSDELPWLSPKNSPKRRRSSPKESSRKRRSTTPLLDEISYKHDYSPVRKNSDTTTTTTAATTLTTTTTTTKTDVSKSYDPVLEARKKKFESKKIIDGSYENKKIKLSKKVEYNEIINLKGVSPVSEIDEDLESVSPNIEINEGLEDVSPIRETNEDLEDVSPVRDIDDSDDDNIHHNLEDISDEEKIQNENNDDKIDDTYDDITETELSLHVNYDLGELEDVVSDDDLNEPIKKPLPVTIDKEKVKKKKKKDKEIYQVGKLKSDVDVTDKIVKDKKSKKKKTESIVEDIKETSVADEQVDEEADLRTELSRRRAERLNRAPPVQSARLLQSAFKGVVKEAAKNNSKMNHKKIVKGDDQCSKKEIRRVTVLHRPDLLDSEDEKIDSKVPIKLRLGTNKLSQETRESKVSRKSSKRQSRKGTKLSTH